jgi:N-acetylneuraminic acid mutarotase
VLSQHVEPSLPMAIQESGAAATPGHLYVVAGYNTQKNSTDVTFVFNGAQWTTGPTLPIRLNHPGVAAIGNRVYLAGGFTPSGASDRVFSLTDGGSQWQELAPLHRARGALSLLALEGQLYAIGGRDGGVQIAIPERYDPATNAWTDLPAMPDPRNHTAGYVDSGQLCVAGGRTPATSAAIDCFDPQSSHWQRVAQLPTATSGAAAESSNGTLLVAGGEPSSEANLVDVVQLHHGSAWTTQPMLVPRHGTGYALFNGRLWLCGGATAPGFHATAACTSIGL